MSEDPSNGVRSSRRGSEAFNRGDTDGVLAIFDPDVETHIDPG